MYVSIPCNLPNGTVFNPRTLAKSAARRSTVDAATNQAQGAFAGLLCRNPADFLRFGRTVAKDVQAVNVATQCKRGSGAAAGSASSTSAVSGGASGSSSSGASGGAAGSQNGAVRGGLIPGASGGVLSGGAAPSCDLTSSEYAVNSTPLNGPGVSSLPDVSAAPAVLTTTGLPKPGLGRWGGVRSRIARSGVRRGVGDCCSGFPAWGDAYPAGAPSSSDSSVLSSITEWIEQNPWLTIGLGAAGVFLLASGKGGRRG